MVDIKFIRDHIDTIKKAVKEKRLDLDVDHLLAVDNKRRSLQQELETLQQQRNENANTMKAAGGKPDQVSIGEGKRLKEEIAKIEGTLREVNTEFQSLMVKAPTIPSPDTPLGKDDSENVELYKWGEFPEFDFEIKDHIQLGKDLDILDIEKGAKVGGYRGYYVKNDGVLLMMSFLMYALQKMAAKGYNLMIPPTLVKGFALFGSGYFKGTEYDPEYDEIYKVATHDKEQDGQTSKESKFLVGTAEPSILAYFADDVLKEEELPIKTAGYSQCYRSEIGSYGKDTKGIYRVHEFMKIEQVTICKADIKEANALQEEMIGISKELHEELGLPYRQLQMCTGDLSAGKYKQYDLEAWIPSRNGYGETGSASNFCDWQARRLNVKYVDTDNKKKYVYMLNNTALPSPRIFIALLENYQNKDGSITIPKALRPFFGGRDKIEKNK